MLYRNKNLTTPNNRKEVTQSSLCLQVTAMLKMAGGKLAGYVPAW